ncbi:AMP-binding protein [uncultured Gilvimarinus sp.]|uniref:AMP-binding protein n=1 Tax=uncultured Gilvimarinus sp. TaxID=1689143 RepID=UPI0030DA08D6
MSKVLASIAHQASAHPDMAALIDHTGGVSYGMLWHRIETLAHGLTESGYQRLGLVGDNSPSWVIADLAAWKAGVTLVPIPSFFSPEQCMHVARSAGLQGLIGELSQLPKPSQPTVDRGLSISPLETSEPLPEIPEGTCKITFTSGTTGQPKGVCLGSEELDAITAALAERLPMEQLMCHMALLPLATLLENIAGVYVPLSQGKTLALPRAQETGLLGSSRLNSQALARTLQKYRPNSLILLPQILGALIHVARESSTALPDSLSFVAVGGAHTPKTLIEQASALGIPAYQGYGLSECASVVCLNTPGNNNLGSVGKPLAHLEVAIHDGVIRVKGQGFRGYLGQGADTSDSEWLDTGDLGYLDQDGFVYITGRRKNLLISSYGRNISPEWIEAELALLPCVAQALIFGDARPFCGAIIVPAVNSDAVQIQSAVKRLNQRLPDYARVMLTLLSDTPFTVANGLLTENGRVRRELVIKQYAERINELYTNATQTESITEE